MRWSKLRSLVRDQFADSVKVRIDIHSTAYGACTCGHAWITLDGEVIANFCTRAKFIAEGMEPSEAVHDVKYDRQLVKFGEFSRQDTYQACWAFVHELSIEEALVDEDPLVQSLAVLDKRLGKRRLHKMDRDGLHRLAAGLLDLRLETERMTARGLTSASDCN